MQQFGGEVRPRVAGQVRPPDLLEGLHAAARGIEQPHVGDARLQGEAFGESTLVADRRVGGAAPNCEVAAGESHLATVDAHRAGNRIGRFQADDFIVFPVRRAGDRTDLVERAGVFQERDAFPHRQPAARVVEGDAVRPTHFLRELGLTVEFGDFPFPTHWRGPATGASDFIESVSVLGERHIENLLSSHTGTQVRRFEVVPNGFPMLLPCSNPVGCQPHGRLPYATSSPQVAASRLAKPWKSR